MIILVISDIHANHVALDAVVQEPHDAVICLGDIVGYGPHPTPCVRWVRDHAGWTVQGNHDRAAAENIPPQCRPDFEWLADAVAPLTHSQLGPEDVMYLRGLPRWATRDIDGIRVACFHARPSDPLYGYMPPDRARWARELANVEADLVLVGHTHLPLDMTIDGKRLINPGSVGQPKDGDPRAAFAVLVNGIPRLKRVSYDVNKTIQDLAASGTDPQAVDALSELLITGHVPARPRPGSA